MNPIIEYFKATANISNDEWEKLKNPDLRAVPDVDQFKGGEEFLRHLFNQKNKVITIMPDYDADGVTSGIYAYYGLKTLNIGSHVNVYFPNADDGFGMSPISVTKALELFPDTDVFLTTDNGLSAIAGTDEANKRGVKVMITDHHMGEDIEPNALAIVNPNRKNDMYPFKGLSGAHVIHKILWAYMKAVCPEKEDALTAMLPLVAISTVADVMPIRDENHSLVKKALVQLNQPNAIEYYQSIMTRFPELKGYLLGLVALLKVMETTKKATAPYNESTFGWVIGPLFNSPRRLTNKPDAAFNLFLQSEWKNAAMQAMYLIELNDERKDIVQTSVDTLEQNPLFKAFEQAPVAQTFKTSASHGVVGIIAGRLTNTYKVPVIAFSQPDENGHIRGSGRSPEGVDILSIVKKVNEKVPNIIVGFGGHEGACGITIHETGWEIFERYFEEYGSQAIVEQPTLEVSGYPVTFPDPIINPMGLEATTIEDKLDTVPFIEALNELELIAPFGHGFDPLSGLITIDLSSVVPQIMGNKRNHIKFKIPFVPFEIIIWSDAQRISESTCNYITIQFAFSLNEWNGRISLQGIGKDYTLHN